MLRWLDSIPLAPIAIAAVALGLSPLLPEPHILRDLQMLVSGQLIKPIDIADFFVHATGPMVLLLKWIRLRQIHSHRRH